MQATDEFNGNNSCNIITRVR